MPTDLACVDGVVMPVAEARIPITDPGLLRGDGVFEVMRVYAGRPFAADDHYARMALSARNLRLDADVDAVGRDVDTLLAAAGAAYDGLVRALVTRGGRRIAVLEPLPTLPASLALGTVVYAPTRVLDGVKSLSYAANMLSGRIAQEAGHDDALLVTPHGRVLEAPTGSFFWVVDGELLTPPLADHILASITRGRIVAHAGATERPCTLEDAGVADEAFIASTVREVLPVHAIDGRELSATPGPVTQRAAETMRAVIARELESHAAPTVP